MELNSQQKSAVTFNGEAKNILVVAGAGCGKTRTIIARAVYLVRSGVQPSRILMLTFTNRAAREMKSRMRKELGMDAYKIQAGTFHSFCLKIMSKIPNSFEINGLNIIDTDDQRELMNLIRSKFIDKNNKELNKEFLKSRELIAHYSYSRNTCIPLEKYLNDNKNIKDEYISLSLLILNEYQKEKEEKGYLDYDDLLSVFASIMEKKDDLRKSVSQLFSEVLVDEMQDTNPLQFNILKQFSNEGTRLFCVGDPAQSIYGFRGAEFKQIYEFEKFFKNSETMKLSLNYRSFQEILDLSNWLLNKSGLEYDNKLISDRGASGSKPLFLEFDTSYDEASWIGDTIVEKVTDNQREYKDFMILVRSGNDARSIETEFLHLGIPYCFIGGTSLTKSAHVRDIMALLRIVRYDYDDLAWMRYLKLWPRLGAKTAERIINNFNDNPLIPPLEAFSLKMGAEYQGVNVYKKVKSLSGNPYMCVQTAIELLYKVLESRYDNWGQRQKDLFLLCTAAEKYTDLSEFIDSFTLEPVSTTELQRGNEDNLVKIITVHSAKGTEAPVCFIANAREGTYPHSRSFGKLENEEEERRILYVAMTRAKDELIITRPVNEFYFYSYNNLFPEGEEYFLEDIPDELIKKFNDDYGQKNILDSLKDIF